MSTTFTAYCAVVVAIYALILAAFHCNTKHSVSRRVSWLSKAASILLFLATICVTLSFFLPRINELCLCQGYFSSALVLYVSSIYLMKYMYLERIKIFNNEPLLNSKYTGFVTKMVSASMILTAIICFYLMIFHTFGMCLFTLNIYISDYLYFIII